MVKQTVLIVLAALVFGGGSYLGHFAMTAWPGPGNWFGSRKPVDAVVLGKLKAELRLTPEQIAQITPIVKAACANLRMLSEEHRAQRMALMDEISSTIAPALSAEQQQRLEALEAELQKRPAVKRDMRIVALF